MRPAAVGFPLRTKPNETAEEGDTSKKERSGRIEEKSCAPVAFSVQRFRMRCRVARTATPPHLEKESTFSPSPIHDGKTVRVRVIDSFPQKGRFGRLCVVQAAIWEALRIFAANLLAIALKTSILMLPRCFCVWSYFHLLMGGALAH